MSIDWSSNTRIPWRWALHVHQSDTLGVCNCNRLETVSAGYAVSIGETSETARVDDGSTEERKSWIYLLWL